MFLYYLWLPCVADADIISLHCGFFFLYFFPRLISVVADWMSTILWHMCGLSTNLEWMSEMCCVRLAENTGRKKSPSAHHCTTLSGYIFATKAHIDNRKKNLLNGNISPTCPSNMMNFGHYWLRCVGEFGDPQQISVGFTFWQRYCTAL